MAFADPEKRRAYMRDYHRRWYTQNKAKHRAWDVAIRDRLSKRVTEYKLKRGCCECGYKKCAAALEFDHVRGEKLADISNMVQRRMGWEKLFAEIQKCEVVCANCHRERTERRRLQAISSEVEQLAYIEKVGGSIPSLPI